MDELVEYLKTLSPGPVTELSDLEERLVPCWEEFDGSAAEGMAGEKLLGRMEEVVWTPPGLTFKIERHGATTLGSTRGEIQEWTLDVSTRTVRCAVVGYRQLHPTAPRLDVGPLAEEIARLIIERQKDERLDWKESGTVWVRITKIIPEESAASQTVEERRKRFRRALEQELGAAGWETIRPNVYQPPKEELSQE